jgi:hypothetical protein
VLAANLACRVVVVLDREIEGCGRLRGEARLIRMLGRGGSGWVMHRGCLGGGGLDCSICSC